MRVIGGTVLQITSAPCLLADEHGNVYAGFALVELEQVDDHGNKSVGRDILPFHTEGSIIGLPDDSYYALHALGDERPRFGEPVDR